MECNKDEALKAVQIAESKMQKGDFEGGLKFASKAKKMYSEVENIAQILTVCEVHGAAQNKLSGSVMDWYGILQTVQSADEATVKKQYRKLALLLHPDKNKFTGAEAAFKLVGEANCVLGDKTKRSVYDMKCKASVKPAAPPKTSEKPAAPPKTSEKPAAPTTSFCFPNGNAPTARYDENARNYKNNPNAAAFWNAYQQAQHQIFWTFCKHCNNKVQYYTNFPNATLFCPKCLKTFTGHDVGNQGVPPVMHTRAAFKKEAPKHGPPKSASESNGGVGGNVPSSKGTKTTGSVPASKGTKATVNVAASERTKANGSVPASNGTKAKGNVATCKGDISMESRTSVNAGSKRVRLSAPANGNGSKDANGGVGGNVPSSKGTKTTGSVPASKGTKATVNVAASKRTKANGSVPASNGTKAKGNIAACKGDISMESRTSVNAGSKRVRLSAPANGNGSKDANVEANGVDPSTFNGTKSSRKKSHVSYVEVPHADGNLEIPSKKPRQKESFNINGFEKREEPASGGYVQKQSVVIDLTI